MLPRVAYISEVSEDADRRTAARRTVHLPASDDVTVRGPRAIILDLSETGLRLQCHSLPEVGETILVDLPLEGTIAARIVWQADGQCGAQFERRVSKASVSAAILSSPARSRFVAPPSESIEQVELLPIHAEWALLALVPIVLLFLFALAFLPISGF